MVIGNARLPFLGLEAMNYNKILSNILWLKKIELKNTNRKIIWKLDLERLSCIL